MFCKDLRIYKIASELETELFGTVKQVTGFCHVKLVDQILRSSASISANIIEGYSRRTYPRDFIRFLHIALGSSDETQHHLIVLYNRKCLSSLEYQQFSKKYKNLSVRIVNYIKYLNNKHSI
jgi:four helix bundle protein